ncbi:substrate-binding periplasmic protein [Billgrantia endophytica]|uniref:Cyclohexadienyl dehydratase n=1 Tax=Billgrantia endophytica TaxID=2033802 RepID=A0A2N7U9V4_9GAMM|nr:ABC transporter substrate-binding protein [Halomonas endophytica]PMR77217.1 cyclohexadienyl dehydratase [Halomonas endophytica]
MKTTKLTISLLLALAMGLGAVSTAVAQSLQDIVNRGTIRIGYIPSPPGTIMDPVSGELRGFYVDGMREIAEQMGVEPEFVETTWGNFVAGLQSGQFDVSIAGTFATVQRSMVVDFTTPIFYLGYGAIVRTDETRYETLEDMNDPDTRIAVVQGGSAEDFARRNMPEATIISLDTGNLTAPFVEVMSNRADVAIEDGYTMSRFIEQQPSVMNLFEENPYNFTPIAWSVRKGNTDLLSTLNAGVDMLISSGQWDALAREYVDGEEATRYINAPNFIAFPRPANAGTTSEE